MQIGAFEALAAALLGTNPRPGKPSGWDAYLEDLITKTGPVFNFSDARGFSPFMALF